ncbi:MAG: polysaccharide pyruvyl transferase family protein [Prevotellaceae bacterium]|nr:polysaccharide pyruvyl transferase family protein [Prevotellaceae bacterium]
MNVLVINQPLGNRGDEAAHRSLMRALLQIEGNVYTVLLANESKERISQFVVKSERIHYCNIPLHRGFMRLVRAAFVYKLISVLIHVHPNVRAYAKYICRADFVLSAPGGICMGQFKNWSHVLWLYIARAQRKPVAYYSRSFGPFNHASKSDKVFYRISLNLLNSFRFLSIRDKKTMDLADSLHLSYIPSIDTAFLDVPDVVVPDWIWKEINSDNYIVFVPNSLTWHPAYRHVDQTTIDKMYHEIMKNLYEKYPGIRVVLLPQLCGDVHGDRAYFIKLVEQCPYNAVVLPDTISSDIQQKIISQSIFVIGARYHSIVFAINNSVPFIALSYEHKIAGLLSLLHLVDNMVDITSIGSGNENLVNILSVIAKRLPMILPVAVEEKYRIEAQSIAKNCFVRLRENI